jgi:hypothetical protein
MFLVVRKALAERPATVLDFARLWGFEICIKITTPVIRTHCLEQSP